MVVREFGALRAGGTCKRGKESRIRIWRFGRTMTLRPESASVLAGDGTDQYLDRVTPNGVPIVRYCVRRSVIPVTETEELYRKRALEVAQGQQREVLERMVREMPVPALHRSWKQRACYR